jgi:hypothetical protein
MSLFADRNLQDLSLNLCLHVELIKISHQYNCDYRLGVCQVSIFKEFEILELILTSFFF